MLSAIVAGNKKVGALTNGIFATVAFVSGGLASLVSGFLGMRIATYANARTALEAQVGNMRNACTNMEELN